MSEYQYFEFQAIDHPLDEKEMAELRAISTRAVITATSFTKPVVPRIWLLPLPARSYCRASTLSLPR